MNRKITVWKIILAVFILVLVDQGAKVLVESFSEFDNEDLMQVANTVHLHPRINYETPEECAELAERTGIDAAIWQWLIALRKLLLGASLIVFIFAIDKLKDIAALNRRKALTNVLLILLGAVTVAGCIDTALWGGTRDFLCISFMFEAASGRQMIGHLASDIKDIYLDISFVLFIYYVIRSINDIYAVVKDKEAFAAFKLAFKERIKSRSDAKKRKERSEDSV